MISFKEFCENIAEKWFKENGIDYDKTEIIWEKARMNLDLIPDTVPHNNQIKDLYTDYYAELEEYEREQNTGNCPRCTTIRNEVKRVIEHE